MNFKNQLGNNSVKSPSLDQQLNKQRGKKDDVQSTGFQPLATSHPINQFYALPDPDGPNPDGSPSYQAFSYPQLAKPQNQARRFGPEQDFK